MTQQMDFRGRRIWVTGAGQGIGLIEDTPSVAEAMERLISEGEATIQERLSGLLMPEAVGVGRAAGLWRDLHECAVAAAADGTPRTVVDLN